MSADRGKTLVLDFSVLPERPKLEIVQRFVEKGLGLAPTDLKSIQLHNIRHCVLLEMADPAAAAETAKLHHLKHAYRVSPTLKIAIPVYVDDNTVDVRVHDLPTDMPNIEIAKSMLQYGEVITIRDEVWKNFFVGVPNGVRVLKMKLTKPVPSYITVCDLPTLATHTGQTITCRRCGKKRHQSMSCSEAAKFQKTPTSNNNQPAVPEMPSNPAVVESQPIVQLNDCNDDDGFTTVGKQGKTKRQLSRDDDDDDQTTTSIDDENCNDQGLRETQLKEQQQNMPKRRLRKKPTT